MEDELELTRRVMGDPRARTVNEYEQPESGGQRPAIGSEEQFAAGVAQAQAEMDVVRRYFASQGW